ncbi:MAG: LysR substrate-binding domain-containing protein [Akkermansiaceae bacterium]
MNVHHLELFYFVAKYEGITAAVRKMPYGIQQPAVSGQILQLEEKLGVKLFNRRPFALTPAGEELYDFVYPFFSRLDDVEAKLKGEEGRHLRLAATASALRNHLPDVLEMLKKQEPDLRLSLREVAPADVHALLTSQQVDVAIGVTGGKMTEGLKAEPLMKIPSVLWVPARSKAKTWRCFIEKDPYAKKGWVGTEPLIGLPPNEFLQQGLQKEFDRMGLVWPVSVEVNSTDVIRDYVSRGFGVGLGIQIPGLKPPKGVRPLSLDGFPPLVVGAMYQGKAKGIVQKFLGIAKEHVKSLA